MPKDPRPRTISKLTLGYFGTMEAGAWPPYNGWESITPSGLGGDLLCWQGRLDLQANFKQELTFFPTGQTIQEPGIFVGELEGSSGTYLEVLEIVSQVPLGLQTIADEWSGFGIAPTRSVPSFLESTSSHEDILVGRYRTLLASTVSSDTTMYNTAKTQNFGSGEPTATDELYIYVLVRLSGLLDPEAENALRVPERRFVIAGLLAEEPDLEYMMRLKRSFELQEKVY